MVELRDQFSDVPESGDGFLVLFGQAQIVALLQVQPELGRGAKGASQPQRRVGGHPALSGDDGADAVGRYADGLRERAGAQPHRHEVLLVQDLSRVNRAPHRIGSLAQQAGGAPESPNRPVF